VAHDIHAIVAEDDHDCSLRISAVSPGSAGERARRSDHQLVHSVDFDLISEFSKSQPTVTGMIVVLCEDNLGRTIWLFDGGRAQLTRLNN
jgi:hypothetical protein